MNQADISCGGIFPPHFLTLIVGKPGSGKTKLLRMLLKGKDLLFKKFDYVFILSPSIVEFYDLFLPKEHYCDYLDFDWIDSKINALQDTEEHINILFVFDDLVADLKSESYNKRLSKLAFNRRHVVNNGIVSIFVTSQKYKTLPTSFRAACNCLIIFKINPSEIDAITSEHIYSEDNFSQIVSKNLLDFSHFLIYNIHFGKYYDYEFKLIETSIL